MRRLLFFRRKNNTRIIEDRSLRASLFLQKKSTFVSEELMRSVIFSSKEIMIPGLMRKEARVPDYFFRKNQHFFSRNNEAPDLSPHEHHEQRGQKLACLIISEENMHLFLKQ